MTLKDQYRSCEDKGRALLAVNFYNFETLSAILRAATAAGSPVILQTTRSTIDYLGLEVTVALARAAIRQYGAEAWLHLDHAEDPELVRRALEAGYDSVMIDASSRPFEENVRLSRKVVREADSYGACVEAELGYIAKEGERGGDLAFTRPDQAKRFVEETGVDALAVAVGSAHGFYDREPELDLDLLERIHRVTPASLVLHGGSGIPDAQIQRAIRRGIRKINLATELKHGFMQTLRAELREREGYDLRKLFPPAMDHVCGLLEKKFALVKGA